MSDIIDYINKVEQLESQLRAADELAKAASEHIDYLERNNTFVSVKYKEALVAYEKQRGR